jgi:hypothetical protein
MLKYVLAGNNDLAACLAKLIRAEVGAMGDQKERASSEPSSESKRVHSTQERRCASSNPSAHH